MKSKYFIFSTALTMLVLSVISLGSFGVKTADAQVYSSSTISQVCINLNNNLFLGSRDSYTNGEVTKLQAFLITNGYLRYINSPTGFYGHLTFLAVKDFQRANGINPVGVVGPYTRGKIQAMSCSGVVVPPVSVVPYINSLSPSSGTVGTTVTVYGSGFTYDNTIHFGAGVIPHVSSSNGTSLSFVVPNSISPACRFTQPACMIMEALTQPGDYLVSVSNANGTSQNLTFTVVSGTNTSGAPVINGVDSPSTLVTGQTGSWTVRAVDTTGGGLSYSVVWGDENQYSPNVYSAMQTNTSFVQSATFTHVYSQAGIYTPVFTVRGSNGQTARTSISVQVTLGTVNTNQSITLGLGQTGYINGGLSIQPTRVLEDSRCPMGVYCIQAGRALVETSVYANGTSQLVDLSFGQNDSQSTTVVNGYTIKITDVQPPKSQYQIMIYPAPPINYMITYQVTR